MHEVSKRVNEAIEQAPIKKLHPTSTEHRKLFESYRTK